MIRKIRSIIAKFRSITARQWKMVGIAFLALLAAGPIWFITYDIMGRTAWKKYAAGEKARGVKLSITDLTLPPVSDEENFGALPIFRDLNKVKSRLPDIPFEIPRGETWLAVPESGFSFPAQRWHNRFAKAGWIDTPSTDVGEDLRVALVRYDDPLNEIAGGLRRPHCSFGVAWAPNPYNTAFPCIQVCQRAAFVATLKANANLVSGNSEAALQDLRFLSGLCTRLAEDPSTIPTGVRINIGRFLVVTTYEGLARHAWSPDQLQEIIDLLGVHDPINDMARWIESERSMANGWSEFILNDKNLVSNSDWALDYPDSWFRDIKVLRTFPGILRRNQLVVNRQYDDFLGRIDLGSGIDWNGESGNPLPKSPYYIITREFSAGLNQWRNRFLALATNFRLAKAACAVELYRSQRLCYPPSLAELVPTYLSAVPREPLSNDAVIYFPTDDGRYRLYSRGLDQDDENGAARYSRMYSKDFHYLKNYRYFDDVPWTAPPPL